MDDKTLFLHTSPGRLFRKAALPGAVSMLAATVFSLMDGIFVGQILGDTAFAAANLAIPFTILNFALAELIGTGSSVAIAVSLGKEENRQANNCFSCACMLIVLTGLAVGLVLYLGAEPLMTLMGAEGELARMAADYLKVYAICSPVTTMTFAVDNYLRLCGKNKLSMFLNLLNYALNIVLDLFFLLVLQTPVWGTALDSCLAMMTGTVLGLLPFALGRLPLRFCRPAFRGRLFQQILASGSPAFLNTVSGRLVSILMNMALLYLGGSDAVVIYGVLMYCGDVVQPLLFGVCDSLQSAIGYNYGAGRMDRVRQIERHVLTAMAGLSFGFVLLLLAVPGAFATLFLQAEEVELMGAAAGAIRIYALTFVTRWFGAAIQSLFTALERPIPAAILSAGYAFVFPLALMGLLWNMGLNGLWLNSVLASLLDALAAGLLLIQAMKKKIFR